MKSEDIMDVCERVRVGNIDLIDNSQQSQRVNAYHQYFQLLKQEALKCQKPMTK